MCTTSRCSIARGLRAWAPGRAAGQEPPGQKLPLIRLMARLRAHSRSEGHICPACGLMGAPCLEHLGGGQGQGLPLPEPSSGSKGPWLRARPATSRSLAGAPHSCPAAHSGLRSPAPSPLLPVRSAETPQAGGQEYQLFFLTVWRQEVPAQVPAGGCGEAISAVSVLGRALIPFRRATPS